MAAFPGRKRRCARLPTRVHALPAVCLVVLFLGSSVADAGVQPTTPTPSGGPVGIMQAHTAATAETASPGRLSASASLFPRAAALTPCDQAADRLCGDVEVPLDRANPAGAQITIHFEVFPHTGAGPTDEAILMTDGGPGFSATQNPFIDFVREQFGSLLEHRDLVLVDQRGVGLSQAIDCPPLQTGAPEDIYAAVAECGAQLGDTSALYGSGDVALDIEAVRQTLGIDKLNFYGASYAAVDGQAYAAHFPGHLRSIVLDSPVRIVGFDPFAESSAEAIARTTRLICKRSTELPSGPLGRRPRPRLACRSSAKAPGRRHRLRRRRHSAHAPCDRSIPCENHLERRRRVRGRRRDRRGSPLAA